MLYIAVNGVNRFCRSKSAAGSPSASVNQPTGRGSWASVGVSTASRWALAAIPSAGVQVQLASAWANCGAA